MRSETQIVVIKVRKTETCLILDVGDDDDDEDYCDDYYDDYYDNYYDDYDNDYGYDDLNLTKLLMLNLHSLLRSSFHISMHIHVLRLSLQVKRAQ